MMTLVKIALAGCALAAVWAFVPIGDRTLSERWHAAGGLERFAKDAFAELRGPPDATDAPPAPAKKRSAPKAPSAPAQARAAQPRRDARPDEAHSDADRRALDRILADRLKD